MTPERADLILTGVTRSLAGWIEELESFQHKCPEATHLLASLKQAETSLRQMMDRGE
jgi:hypothetical protein